MKKYRIYYVIKMNNEQDPYYLDVEADNVKAAKDKVCAEVLRLTGRHAFHPATKPYGEYTFEGMPPKKPGWSVKDAD